MTIRSLFQFEPIILQDLVHFSEVQIALDRLEVLEDSNGLLEAGI